jgi:hypothetical protein
VLAGFFCLLPCALRWASVSIPIFNYGQPCTVSTILNILVLLVWFVSKSFFPLIVSVVILTAGGAGLPTGADWWEETSVDLHAEVIAAVNSLKYDSDEFRAQAVRVPFALRSLWYDAQADIRTLEADTAAAVRTNARRIASLVKTPDS